MSIHIYIPGRRRARDSGKPFTPAELEDLANRMAAALEEFMGWGTGDEFREEDHPRREDGKFGSQGGGGAKKSTPAIATRHSNRGASALAQMQAQSNAHLMATGKGHVVAGKAATRAEAEKGTRQAAAVYEKGKLYIPGQEPSAVAARQAAPRAPVSTVPAKSAAVYEKGKLYISGQEPSAVAGRQNAEPSWAKSSAAKNASRAAERSTQGGSGDPHALHTAASVAHAEAAEEAKARGDRVNAQIHSDKSVFHAGQAKLHAPATS